jgi:hypothetical protein
MPTHNHKRIPCSTRHKKKLEEQSIRCIFFTNFFPTPQGGSCGSWNNGWFLWFMEQRVFVFVHVASTVPELGNSIFCVPSSQKKKQIDALSRRSEHFIIIIFVCDGMLLFI